jgi:DNA-binding response OmpR family regulator
MAVSTGKGHAVKTILVLDDDTAFTELLKTVFELEGYQAVTVSAADDLLPAVREAGPALVLMDVHIAQANTFGVVRELRSDESLLTLPVVMTSGTDYRQESLDVGANAFLAKPFRPPELLALIAGLVEG